MRFVVLRGWRQIDPLPLFRLLPTTRDQPKIAEHSDVFLCELGGFGG